jgi:hypothetical protein
MGTSTKKLNFNELVIALATDLNEREKEVIMKRYALDGNEKSTLEKIGQKYDITRERVRQIENEGLKKVRIKATQETPTPLSELEDLVANYIKQHGFIGQGHLMSNLLHTEDEIEIQALDFLLSKVVSEKFSTHKHPAFDYLWRSNEMAEEIIEAIGNAILEIVESKGAPMSMEEILGVCPECSAFNHINTASADNAAIIEAVLKARKDIGKNILDQWGRDTWTTIKPKRMTDKAYLILLQERRPLHFEEVAELINRACFDKKKACAATVHNELILDNKYVLVGRGMYALKDWGYQEGTVSDVIAAILKNHGSLSKADISEEVLKQRMVQKTTITLALMNKDRFTKMEDGRYALA